MQPNDRLSDALQAVIVTFPTNVDLRQHQMTDAMWIDLGKFVARLAAETRRLNENKMSTAPPTLPGG